jgi:hypothetical protein
MIRHQYMKRGDAAKEHGNASKVELFQAIVDVVDTAIDGENKK